MTAIMKRFTTMAVAGLLAGSLSVISDAIHSSVDSINNIVGLVACADMSASKLMDTNESDLLDMDFESLVIDVPVIATRIGA